MEKRGFLGDEFISKVRTLHFFFMWFDLQCGNCVNWCQKF